MDPIIIITKMQKRLKQDLELVSQAMIEGVDNYDKYKYLVGQAHAYSTILQEISNLLNEKEQNEDSGTVIDISKRDT
jgi:hypothetical protein|tara:strand:- start:330 stop:560 length:231 start_codon:yes stop_codon:yes gene_type:complete